MKSLRRDTLRMRLLWLGGALAAVLAVFWGSALAPNAGGQTPSAAATGLRVAVPVPGADLPTTDQTEDDVAPMQGDCGDGRCNPPEDCHSCESDCGSCCGNHRCEAPEDCRSCPGDCGGCCGDGRCDPPEDHRSCPRDC